MFYSKIGICMKINLNLPFYPPTDKTSLPTSQLNKKIIFIALLILSTLCLLCRINYTRSKRVKLKNNNTSNSSSKNQKNINKSVNTSALKKISPTKSDSSKDGAIKKAELSKPASISNKLERDSKPFSLYKEVYFPDENLLKKGLFENDVFVEGQVFEGEILHSQGHFLEDYLHGNGKKYYDTGKVALEGTFERGILIKGKKYLLNGDCEEGEFVKHELVNGTITHSNGVVEHVNKT